MKSSSLSRGLCVAAVALVLGAIATLFLLPPTLQETVLAFGETAVAAIIGNTSLVALTPLLFKMLFFVTLSTLVWGWRFSAGGGKLSTLLLGLAATVLAAFGLELLQLVHPLYHATTTDALWSALAGAATSFGFFAGEWAAQKFPSLVNRETVLYVIFGGLTTVVNIVVFQVSINLFAIPTLIANGLAWVLAVLTAYVTNKLWVFESHTTTLSAFLREIGLFFGARLLSFGVDEVGIWLLVDILHCNSGLSKIGTNIIVLIMNYLFSKWFIFKDDKKTDNKKNSR